MTALRLLADDLTGALDTAAEFVGLCGPVEVFWSAQAGALPASAALDTGTREMGEAAARAAVAAATPALVGGTLAFKKIDSLIRGQTLPELETALAAGPWRTAVLAPAFPFQGRMTIAGQQRAGGVPVGPNLIDALAGAYRAQPGDALRPGIAVFDARTDADLDAVVDAVGREADVLWCGAGGLARALAARHPLPALPPLPRPVLGLFGSDQAVTAGQLAACEEHWCALRGSGAASAAHLAERLERHGVALVSLDLTPGIARDQAAALIAAALGDLARRLPTPGTLAVAGGETLRSLCVTLGAGSLRVRGRAVPGVPVSTIVGGVWDGVTVLSKSGAFGHPTLLRELLALPERSFA